jgi:hypothetical protein
MTVGGCRSMSAFLAIPLVLTLAAYSPPPKQGFSPIPAKSLQCRIDRTCHAHCEAGQGTRCRKLCYICL